MLQTSKLHIQEIIDFLGEVVIKFEPMIKFLNEKPEYAHLINDTDPKTFPYYRIIMGDATMASVPIYGFLPDNETEILLTKENLEVYPNMRNFYKFQDHVDSLLARYPNDQFLIKRILNPVKDIDAAIAAKNLTLLETTEKDRFLNKYERDDLIFFLQFFLEKFEYRWYINTFEYEDLYPFAFWAMLWNILPFILLTRRIMNIRTCKVHPFHIWEHLISTGFGSYKGYLSRDQEMFLYRNAEYLKYNVGKKFILQTLSDVFLSPIKHSLNEKMIICSTAGREDTFDKVPEVLSVKDNQIDYSSSVMLDSFLTEVYRNGNDIRNDVQYQDDIRALFATCGPNVLYTKFIELIKNTSTSEMMLLLRFILDSTVYLASVNKLQYKVTVVSPKTNKEVVLNSVTDALNLIFYCIYKKNGDTPINTFTKYTLVSALSRTTKPDKLDVVFANEYAFHVDWYVEAEDIINNAPYVVNEIISPAGLSNVLGDQYTWLFDLIHKLQLTSDSAIHEILHAVYRTLIPELKVIEVPQVHTTFEAYFNTYPKAEIIANESENADEYNNLIRAIFEAICPLAYGFSSLAEDDKNATILVFKLKELFSYLTSYNVSFITPIIDRADHYELPKLTAHILPLDLNTDIDSLEWGRNAYDYEVSLQPNVTMDLDTEISFVTEMNADSTSITINFTDEPMDEDLLSGINDNHAIFITNCGLELVFENTI